LRSSPPASLVWFNVRRGRADLRGATRLSLIYFLCLASVKLLQMHHSATLGEIDNFWTSIGGALVNGGLIWVFYAALEPWVRRKWPRTMISWTRYTTKGASDPLVGRDLLYGTVFGIILDFGDVVDAALHGNNHQPLFPPLNAMLGVRAEIAGGHRSGSRRHLHRRALFFHTLPAAPGIAQGLDCRHHLRSHSRLRYQLCFHHALGRPPAGRTGLRGFLPLRCCVSGSWPVSSLPP
jgi:hypothetical protein